MSVFTTTNSLAARGISTSARRGNQWGKLINKVVQNPETDIRELREKRHKNQSNSGKKTVPRKPKSWELLRRKFGSKLSDSDIRTPIGPRQNHDTVLLQLNDRDLSLKILGTTNNQLRDSYVVAEDVQTFLKHGQLDKAISLCKLARINGTVATNHVIRYLCESRRVNAAILLFGKMKKWGAQPNPYTYSLLFSGAAKLGSVTEQQAQQLLQIARAMIGTDRKPACNLIQVNSALAALANSEAPQLCWQLFCEIFSEYSGEDGGTIGEDGGILRNIKINNKGLKPDCRTFTHVFRALQRLCDKSRAFSLWSSIRNKSEKRELTVDPHLLVAYVEAITSGSNSESQLKHSVELVENWFVFDSIPEKSELLRNHKPNNINFSSRKFPVNVIVLDLYCGLLLRLGENEKALSVFANLVRDPRRCKNLDRGLAALLFRVLTLVEPSETAEEVLRAVPQLCNNGVAQLEDMVAVAFAVCREITDAQFFPILERFRSALLADSRDVSAASIVNYLRACRVHTLNSEEYKQVMKFVDENNAVLSEPGEKVRGVRVLQLRIAEKMRMLTDVKKVEADEKFAVELGKDVKKFRKLLNEIEGVIGPEVEAEAEAEEKSEPQSHNYSETPKKSNYKSSEASELKKRRRNSKNRKKRPDTGSD